MDQCTPSYSELDDIYKSDRILGDSPSTGYTLLWLYPWELCLALGFSLCFMATTSLEAMCHHSSATIFCPTMGLDAMKPAWVESSETRSLGKASPLCVGQHVSTGKGWDISLILSSYHTFFALMKTLLWGASWDCNSAHVHDHPTLRPVEEQP